MISKLVAAAICATCLAWSLPSSAQDEPKDEPKKEAKLETLRFTGSLNANDPKDKVQTDSPHKVHVVKLQAGQFYQIDLKKKDANQDWDPYLRIEDAKGNELDQDDDSGGDLDSRIFFDAKKAGDYRIIATCLNGTGDYVLTVTPKGEPKVQALAAVGQGLNVKGRLAEGGVAPQYRVKLEANKTYIIDMESEDFDSFLVLHDAKGEKLADDDDGGDDLNARIRYQANADGEFIITTRSYNGGGGNYTLKIREEK